MPLDNIAKRAEAYKPKERVTYKMIKEYIEAKYGFKVHTAYIAEVKKSLGLPMYDAPNAVEELKQPRKHPTAEKVEAIKDALKHFEVIYYRCGKSDSNKITDITKIDNFGSSLSGSHIGNQYIVIKGNIALLL